MAKAQGKYYRVAVVTDNTPQTGSIAKIFSAGESGSTVNVFDDVKFGVYSSEGDGIVSNLHRYISFLNRGNKRQFAFDTCKLLH